MPKVTQCIWVSKGRAGKVGWAGLAETWPPVSFWFFLDPEQQAVQGVLCEGDSRQSRLLGLVRHRLKHGGQEHA